MIPPQLSIFVKVQFVFMWFVVLHLHSWVSNQESTVSEANVTVPKCTLIAKKKESVSIKPQGQRHTCAGAIPQKTSSPCKDKAILTSCVSDVHSVGREACSLFCIAVFVYRVPSFSEADSCRLFEKNKSKRKEREKERKTAWFFWSLGKPTHSSRINSKKSHSWKTIII